MRVRILSDLHLEHFDEGRDIPDVEADLVILAGDIHQHLQGLAWAAERFKGLPVLYVPGNHEFYGASMPTLRREMRDEAQRLGIHLLDNDVLVHGGVRFLGTTLWTDFALYDGEPEHSAEQTELKARMMMPDFHIIEQPEGEVLTPQSSRELHRQALAWLTSELETPFAGPTVVVSHHAPLAGCIPPCYQGDALSPAFASHLESLMGPMTLWIHGHVHEPVDLTCQGTRVIANPGGYPGEFEPSLFVPDQVIAIQAGVTWPDARP
ncbi:metallophosphoesterase family protein [Billgrantia endophytica]|uniref:Metallo-dependent phosphatase n=1 Tax=Billgrantia endophytica TaxID=2033802 RepID=A0A2N7U434_9GAMM|nr:metallophosphoesterase family protein [Halomonas endophytica]PMR75191.1 metallo-dependent phosphatase [Halomonas endophytica]